MSQVMVLHHFPVRDYIRSTHEGSLLPSELVGSLINELVFVFGYCLFVFTFHHKHTYLHLYYYTEPTIPQGSTTILCLEPSGHMHNTTLNRYLGI